MVLNNKSEKNWQQQNRIHTDLVTFLKCVRVTYVFFIDTRLSETAQTVTNC
jgi:hypothetical protein